MTRSAKKGASTVGRQAERKVRRKRLAGKEEETHVAGHSGDTTQPRVARQPTATTQRLPREERQAVVTSTGALLGNRQLQKQLGATVVQTQAAPVAAPTRTSAQVAALIERVVQAIAQHETGGQAVESRMRTSAGVAASLASQVQATMPWALTALLQLDDVTLQREFNLTRPELRSAQQRVSAAGQLWDAVHAAGPTITLEAFLADRAHQRLLARSGLTQEELARMLAFRKLRHDLTTAFTDRQSALQALSTQQLWDGSTRRDRNKAGVKKVTQISGERRSKLVQAMARREVSEEFATVPAAVALRINEASLDAYLRRNWREDRAAWTRIAASREPPPAEGVASVGPRLEAAVTAEEGLHLGRERIGRLVQAYLDGHPAATDREVCHYAARQHNPGGGEGYAAKVLSHF